MNYEALWHRLTKLYETGEAKAIVRWVLDVRFGLTLTDIVCGKLSQLSADDRAELEGIMQKLERAEPVQYVIGLADFCGRQFRVAPGVLIPRPETAELCQWVEEEGGRWKVEGEYNILDIGTGSGCIAITLALDIPDSRVTGWDISEEALRIAQENARRLQAPVTFEKHDVLNTSLSSNLSSLTTQPWDLIISNPPYIQPAERDEMARNVLDYEPALALFAPEEDPIVFYRRIGEYAKDSLKPGGHLCFELNPLTGASVGDYLAELGFSDVEIRPDASGKERLLKATMT